MNSAKNAPKPAKLTPNVSLKHRNSFGLESTAELAYEIISADQLPALMREFEEKKLTWRVLGGGSNVILPDSLPGVTLLINILGVAIVRSDEANTQPLRADDAFSIGDHRPLGEGGRTNHSAACGSIIR